MEQVGPERVIGRYALYGEIASGGMATVHFGRLMGPVGFARTVAIKRLHPHLAKDPQFVAMFLDEARLVARIRHPNVVPTLDVVAEAGELLLVMEYVQGEVLSRLIRRMRGRGLPPTIVSAVMINVLQGLNAAHEATNEYGVNLNIVHRDVSPQNIIVGIDGVARVLDFGVAKAIGRVQDTQAGTLKGKLGYMSPEQLLGHELDRRSDVFAASVVLWNALTGQQLFPHDHAGRAAIAVLHDAIPPPSSLAPGISPTLDRIVLRGLARARQDRYATTRQLAIELEDVLPPATTRVVSEWVDALVGEKLAQRAERIAAIESESVSNPSLSSPGTSPGSGPISMESIGGAISAYTPAVPTVSEPVRSRRAALLAVGGLALLCAVLVVAFGLAGHWSGSGADSEAAGASAGPSPASPSAEHAAATAPSGSSPASASAAASATADATASATTTSSAAAPLATVVRPPPRTTPHVPPAPEGKPTVDCTNPFIIDADGKKRPRPECF